MYHQLFAIMSIPDLAIWWQKQPANLPYKAQSSKDPVFVFCSLRWLAAGGGVLLVEIITHSS